MIDADQLAILRDMFKNCDDEYLMLHVSVKREERRGLVIEFDKCNEQDMAALFERKGDDQ